MPCQQTAGKLTTLRVTYARQVTHRVSQTRQALESGDAGVTKFVTLTESVTRFCLGPRAQASAGRAHNRCFPLTYPAMGSDRPGAARP
jgi:hypothetical protein